MGAPASRKSRPSSRRDDATSPAQRKPIIYEIIGLCFIVLGLIVLCALCVPSVAEGSVPRAMLWVATLLFGTVGAWGIGIAFIVLGGYLLIRRTRVELSITALGMGIVFVSIISMAQLTATPVWNPGEFAATPGGTIGGCIAALLHNILGLQGLSWVVLMAFVLGGLALVTDMPLWQLMLLPFHWIIKGSRTLVRPAMAQASARREAERAAKVAALQEAELQRRNRPEPEMVTRPTFPPRPQLLPEPVIQPQLDLQPDVPVGSADAKPAVRRENPHDGFAQDVPVIDDECGVMHPQNRPYALPSLDLLTPTVTTKKICKDDMTETVAALEQSLSSFGIDAKVVGVERGPRITRFELVPPPGIRVNRITNLADDIALALAALDVRVEAPVPGKGVVGIEVPNKESVIVGLREILESEACVKAKSPCAFVLGKDIAGVPRVADLTKMPHLLIAGQTNSGKSVCINTLLCSILMRATPQQVKFLMVDPKRVELSLYQSIPHLIAPVAYDAKHAAGLLRWAIREMEERYGVFAEKGVRNIVGYNEQARMEGLEEYAYIVIIIDELADLMMQAAAEFEASICRLAQLARATGIHLVVATQRPSVNVITGTIKANIPSRISFAVASQVDSRTVLDMNGAERLVGQGDMLFLPVEASKPVRIQGAYMSEKEINKIVEHVKSQGKPSFTDAIMAIEEDALREESSGDTGGSVSDDDIYDKALDYVRTTKYASTSMLQRKFRIGYTRAARLMDLFEERGFVGPGQGSKPREVIFAPATSVVSGRTAVDAVSDALIEAYGDDERV